MEPGNSGYNEAVRGSLTMERLAELSRVATEENDARLFQEIDPFLGMGRTAVRGRIGASGVPDQTNSLWHGSVRVVRNAADVWLSGLMSARKKLPITRKGSWLSSN